MLTTTSSRIRVALNHALGDHLRLVVFGQWEELEIFRDLRLRFQPVDAGRRRVDELPDALSRGAIDEAHAREDVHFPRGIRVELDRRIVGDVRQVKDGVVRRKIDLVDLPDVHRLDRQPRMRRQSIAEPHDVEHGDVVRRAREQRVGQLGADIPAPASDE
jgi:hypothetical protein